MPRPGSLNIQGQQHVSWGTLLTNVPPDLLSDFEWLFKEVLSGEPPTYGQRSLIPPWKVAVIKAVGGVLHALMICGVAFSVIGHPGQHNPDGSHKTIQVQGSDKETDDGGNSDVENGDDDTGADGGNPADDNIIHMIGRFEYRAGFKDIWLGDVHYDLRCRAKARLCLRCLVENEAFDEQSALDLEAVIDPFVREHCCLEKLPKSSQSNLRIQHFFHDRDKNLNQLRLDLVKPAGRNGRFYLQVF